MRGEVEEPSEEEKWKFQPLLDWDTVNQKIPWGVLLLMGGGFAVAEACEVRTAILNAIIGSGLVWLKKCFSFTPKLLDYYLIIMERIYVD